MVGRRIGMLVVMFLIWWWLGVFMVLYYYLNVESVEIICVFFLIIEGLNLEVFLYVEEVCF